MRRTLNFLVILICVLLVSAGNAGSQELVLLKGDGLKRDVTLSDMQKYVGGLADVSQKTWELFVGLMPGMLSVAKDSMNAIAVHQKLSKGSISDAAKSVLDYGIGYISGEWESAGYGPLATMMTAFSVYDASLDFIQSQWFMPSLVDSVYEKYKAERGEGQTHEAVWETFGTYLIQPIKGEVKNKVIYPRHNLKDMSDDKTKATRWVTGKVGTKTIKVTFMDKSNWPYGETQKVYILHKGKGTTPLFATTINMEVWDLSNMDALLLDTMNDLYTLNDIKYPKLENRFSETQMKQLETKLRGMLQELKDKDIGPELDVEAEEYIGQMLQVRYAREAADKFKTVAAKTRSEAEKDLLDVAKQLKEFRGQQPETVAESPEEEGPILAERQKYIALWKEWMDASKAYHLLENKGSPQGFAALKARDAAGRAFLEYGTATFTRIPEMTSPIMLQAMKTVRDIQSKVTSAVTANSFPVAAAGSSIPATEKALLEPKAPTPDLPPEGQKQTVLDNPQFGLKYWLVAREGHLRMEGFYKSTDGKKVEYTGRPIDPVDPVSAAMGLFASASGTGYHVYIEEKGPWQPASHSVLNVTVMKGTSISEKGRYDIHQLGYKVGEAFLPFILEAPQTQGGAWVLKYKVYERRNDIMDVSGLQERTITFD
ncbi:MAG: hypothetical protein Q7I97_06180 [Thermovirgaceae bacterium]|nr:hypothetical protein [Thermovirgaceae bacterium]